MAQEQIVSVFSQHVTYINRVAAGFGNDVLPYLDGIYSGINQIYGKYSSRKNITPELQETISAEISSLVSSELQAYTRELKKDQRELGIYEAEFSANELEQVVVNEDFKATVPAAAQITAAAVATPIKIGENSYVTYNTMMRNYWQKWTADIDAIVANGFVGGQSISEIQSSVLEEIKPSKTGVTKSALDKARRQARSISITGTNHYANQARVLTGKDNEDVIKGYEFISVIDSVTSPQCRPLDGRKFASDDPDLNRFTPPLHPNCRSALVYDVDERYTVQDETSKRASRFRVDGDLDPKQISSTETYYHAMNKLNAADQDAILGPTLGKAFRKLNNPDEFARLTVDSLRNPEPLTISEIKERDTALSRILNKG
jgi:SPP1 gp7 family putative phage head morphogenesis protein